MESLRGGHPTGGVGAFERDVADAPACWCPRRGSQRGLYRRDLRGRAERRTLRFPARDVVVVSGLPGSGKSTLIRRTVRVGGHVLRLDSQEMREKWARRTPSWLPYAVYRPLVRVAHLAALHRALTSERAAVVHACGAQAWVLRWIAWSAHRRGSGLHLVLLDVPAEVALRGQTLRGRRVSAYAFLRHRRAVARLVEGVERGRLPWPCASVVLLDRDAAAGVRRLAFARPELARSESEHVEAGRRAGRSVTGAAGANVPCADGCCGDVSGAEASDVRERTEGSSVRAHRAGRA